jgi:hypothetical protein
MYHTESLKADTCLGSELRCSRLYKAGCWCNNATNSVVHSPFDFRRLLPESLNGGN